MQRIQYTEQKRLGALKSLTCANPLALSGEQRALYDVAMH